MKHIIPTDRNTFFNVRRENLQSLRRPLKRGNVIPESYKESGMYYDEKAWQPFPKVYGGAGQTQDGHSSDKNIFFQTRIRQKPFLRKRIFKDLEPTSRVIGKLALTKKERDAENMLKSVGAIGTLMSDFLSEPVLDAAGNPVIDPVTNKPVMQKRSLFEILQVARGGVLKLFQDLSIPRSRTMDTLINSLSTDDSISVVSRVKDIIASDPNRTVAERNALVKQVILNERLSETHKIEDPKVQRAVVAEVLEQKISTGEAKSEDLGPWITPTDWGKMNADVRDEIRAFIITRESNTANKLRKPDGARISFKGLGLIMPNQFTKQKNFLSTNTLKFHTRAQMIAMA